MRIALFHNLPNGGAKKVVFNQIATLSKKHEVELFTITTKERDFLSFDSLSCVKHYYDFDRDISSRALRDITEITVYKALHKKIAHDIDTKGFDVVICHPDMITQAPFLLRYLRTKSVYYCEELLRIAYESEFSIPSHLSLQNKLYEKAHRLVRKNIDAENIKQASVVLANSSFTKNTIEKEIGIHATVIYPGVDTKLFYAKKTKKTIDILFIGERSSLEGYDLLEKALLLFPNKPTVEVISKREKGEWISDTELSRFYRKSKVVVAFSRNEPFGLIPIEAMSCGIPVVGVKEGGIQETIIHNKSGFLVKRDEKEVYERISYLLEHDEVRESMGEYASVYIKKEWNLTKRTDELLTTL